MKTFADLLRTTLAILITLLMIPALIGMATAAGYPEKEINLMVPYAPGGATDLMFRAIGTACSDGLRREWRRVEPRDASLNGLASPPSSAARSTRRGSARIPAPSRVRADRWGSAPGRRD